jgi:hypothetical protein
VAIGEAMPAMGFVVKVSNHGRPEPQWIGRNTLLGSLVRGLARSMTGTVAAERSLQGLGSWIAMPSSPHAWSVFLPPYGVSHVRVRVWRLCSVVWR